MTDPADLSATAALAAFRRRALSPVELLAAVVARIEAVEPVVGALVDVRLGAAAEAARAAERRFARGGPPPRPLEGLLVAVKEVLPVAGASRCEGLALWAGRPPERRSAEVVRRVEAAGGIVHARTTTSELCCMPVSHAGAWGVTRNPWNPAAAVGGSSGGSAAALAAGCASLALGTDVGGSIRAPAAYAGVVGVKPPRGRVPLEPPLAADPWQHAGPLARTTADAQLLLDVLTGAPAPPGADGIAGLRVAVCARPGDLPVEPEVAAATEAAGRALAAAGATVAPVELPWSLQAIERAMWGRGEPAPARALLAVEARRPGTMAGYTRVCLERSVAAAAATSPAERTAAGAALRVSVEAALAAADVLVVPTMGALSLAAGEDYDERPLVVDGRPLEHFCDAALTPPFNAAGACPVVAVPSGAVGAHGVPIGVQVVARAGDERTALRAAAALERERPGGRPPLEALAAASASPSGGG